VKRARPAFPSEGYPVKKTPATKQVRWKTETSSMPTEILNRALIWGLQQDPPIRGKTEVVIALIERGLKA
jgi:hypothetical protein